MDYQAARPEDETLPRPAAPQAPAPGTARPASAAEADGQEHARRILARPLFNTDRRPLAAAGSAPAGGQADLPRLSAILVSGRGRSVIFAGSGGGKPVTVAEGDRIGPYLVQAIGAGQVTLAGPGGTRVLRPAFDGNAPVAAAPAAPSVLDLLRQGTPGVPQLAPQASPRAAR